MIFVAAAIVCLAAVIAGAAPIYASIYMARETVRKDLVPQLQQLTVQIHTANQLNVAALNLSSQQLQHQIEINKALVVALRQTTPARPN